MNNTSRIDFIDLAKGFCILLVVFAHCCSHPGLETSMDDVLGSFRMPLYFFLSGLFFKMYDSFAGFVKRKINKLLIPFVFFYLTCSVCLPNILYELGYSVRNIENIGWLNSLSVIFSPTQRTFSNGPVWFLLCLFNINIIFYTLVLLTNRLKMNTVFLCLVCIAIGIFGGNLRSFDIQLPLYIDTALTSLPFFACGFFIKKYTNILTPNKEDRYLLLYACLCLAYTILFADRTSFQHNEFGNLWSLYTCGITGTLFVIFVAKMVGSLPLISFFGRYSIIILCTHQMVIQIVWLFVKRLAVNDWFIILLMLLLTLAIEMLLIPMFRKYMPHVTAQKDVIKIDK